MKSGLVTREKKVGRQEPFRPADSGEHQRTEDVGGGGENTVLGQHKKGGQLGGQRKKKSWELMVPCGFAMHAPYGREGGTYV